MKLQNNSLLETIQRPQDIQNLSLMEMEELATELRKEIIYTVSQTGGHLAPSLGVVELTLALLHVFDPQTDKIVWDVGHQTYAYKILTRGREKFRTLRQLDGISGFPRLQESIFDHFGVGHSSTSISASLGMAVARDMESLDHRVLAVIGDGALTAGMAFEALNQAGDLGRDLVVILNDNEMSISKNVGALSSFLSRKLSEQGFLRFKEDLKTWLRQVPKIGDELIKYAGRSEDSLKSFFTPGMLFESLKFNYLGPINGHSLRQLVKIFSQVESLKGPVLIHTITTKGKGYPPAEKNPTAFHGVGPFDPETGQSKKNKSTISYGHVFGETLSFLAQKDPRIIAITAAMPDGTGLNKFQERFPDRFFDVGICEQHAVTFAAGLANSGYRPVVSIYSTFLQRAYDQVVHDVCLQNLPVVFCLDRGGLVGEDGPTHHGAFDLSYLRHIPNMTLMAPKDEPELQSMLKTALNHTGPTAIRYPRGCGPGHELLDEPKCLPWGEGQWLRKGNKAVILAVGSCVMAALQALEKSEKEQNKKSDIGLLNVRFIQPLPGNQIEEALSWTDRLLLIEENVLAGGFGSAVLEYLADKNLLSKVRIKRLGLPGRFIAHGSQVELRKLVCLDLDGITQALKELLS